MSFRLSVWSPFLSRRARPLSPFILCPFVRFCFILFSSSIRPFPPHILPFLSFISHPTPPSQMDHTRGKERLRGICFLPCFLHEGNGKKETPPTVDPLLELRKKERTKKPRQKKEKKRKEKTSIGNTGGFSLSLSLVSMTPPKTKEIKGTPFAGIFLSCDELCAYSSLSLLSSSSSFDIFFLFSFRSFVLFL